MSDLLFSNGTVFDGSRFLPAGTSVRVRGGAIVEVGADLAADSAEVVDLAGGTLLPGFIDAHAHPVFAGNQLRHCDLRGGDTSAEYAAIVAAYSDSHPDETWITGGGWSMDAFPGGLPTRDVLDAVVPDRPTFLPNRDGHGAWVNTAALARAGIDRHTPDPRDGRIERDHHGDPTGMLQEGAADLVSRLLPTLSDDDWYAALLAAQSHLLTLGVTGWQDAIVGSYAEADDPLPAYLRAAGNGALTVNVVGALWWDRDRGEDQIPELIHRREIGQAGRFHANAVKLMLDGVAETHTAAMLEPYLDHDGCASQNTGLDFIDPAGLPHYIAALDALGFQAHFHALGDRAVRNALDAIEASQKANHRNEISGPRHHLAHVQVVHPDDLPRFAALSATANIQPLWAMHDVQMDELTIPFLGDRRSGWQYPFGSLRAAGAALCAGSDWPVSSPNPLEGAHVAVNRTPPEVRAGADPFLPDEAIPLASILAAYTSGSARVNGLDATTGAVRAGLDADFAIVDADLAHIDASDIGRARVTSTWIRGSAVYEA
jgi:predicted amidohydrolase YtcJ